MKNSESEKHSSGHGGARVGAGRKPFAKSDLQLAAMTEGATMIELLLKMAKDEAISPNARIKAATTILERGYGRPTEPVEITKIDSTAETIAGVRELMELKQKQDIERLKALHDHKMQRKQEQKTSGVDQ